MILSTQTDFFSNKVGIKKCIDYLAAAGYDAADMSLFSEKEYYDNLYSRDFYIELRKYAEDKGMFFNQAHAPFCGSGVRDTERVHANFDKVVNTMRNASLLGAKIIVVHPCQHLKYSDPGNSERLFEFNMEYYTKLIPYCEEFGIKVALENMWQYEKEGWNKIGRSVCSKPEEYIRYLDTLNNDCFVACLDMGHAALVCEDVADFIRMLGNKRLKALHVHDVSGMEDTHTLPYFGIIDWDKVTKALAEIGYDGDLTFEADGFFKSKPAGMYSECAEFMVKTGRFLIDKIKTYGG